tara:strand:+ start:4677 stop:5846 length:1170 start_codon:yes stop_codon:yes gene_type:complete
VSKVFDDIVGFQKDASERGNAIEQDHISRGTFGPEHMVDSVIFSARDFSSGDSTLVCGTGGDVGVVDGGLSKYRPMSVGDYYWGSSVVGPDFESPWGWEGTSSMAATPNSFSHATRDFLDSVVIQRTRRHWHLVPCGSSKHYAERLRSGYPDAVEGSLDRATTDDWTAGSFIFTAYADKFGHDLFKIANNGRDFALLFNCNFELKYATTFPSDGDGEWDSKGKNRWRRWEGGCRLWSSIIYFLKPNPDAPFVLKWSPRHMIGCSAASYNPKTSLNAPTINDIHSYQDVIQVNNEMIERLCRMSGVRFTANMELDSDASFGWATMAGIDRWDGLPPSDERVDEVDMLGKYTYSGGQPVRIDNGNCSFVAFNYSPPNEDLTISLRNNFIGL